ncbi:uncharacterized protein LOC105430386 [Pogonomyrmex barbatus]|uniref:Uncharacterized protein LOC105430386 n=1 Tax=Pogonomyrmex barbatus TaxID=144034 RepID=A0A6I9WRH5_9HYME|nr:uncharacterized protein LOC105430386 [Pogonomyrmex barbatus]
MRCTALCVLLLAISESLLTYAKVVVIVPRQVRRSPAVPWRPPGHYKKSSYGGNDFHRHAHYGHVNRYKKPFRPLPYGGHDNFDHSHEGVNHVNVPYGKDVSHNLSFGKGYVPYDGIKSNSLPLVRDRYAGAYARQPAVPDYPPTSFTSVGQEYTASATHSYDNPQVDSYFSDMENAARGELRGSLKESVNKYYGTRSIEKDLSLRNQQALSSIIENNKDTENLSKDTSSVAYVQAASVPTSATIPTSIVNAQGAVILPAGIPPATIAGNKDGIVLRDTVSLDEYQRKLEELTKTWPNMLSSGTNFVTTGAIAAPQQLHAGFSTGLPGAAFSGLTGGVNWVTNLAQAKQGYAVREDHGDPTTYDFRTMTITQNSPYQILSFGGVPASAGIAQSAHG